MHYKYFEPETEWIDGEEFVKVLPEKYILQRRRKELGLTQKEVADRAGIQIRQYQRFESGERMLYTSSGRILLAVARALKLDPCIFAGYGNEPPEEQILLPQIFANAVKARATANRCTETDVICDALDSYLFGKNGDAVMWSRILCDDASLADLYIQTMAFMAEGIQRQAKYPNGEPLVALFAQEISKCSYRFNGDDNNDYLLTVLDAIAKLMSSDVQCRDQQLLLKYIDQLQHLPEDVMARDIVALIACNFAVLGNSTWTYRALADIATRVADELPDDPKVRTAYLAILQRMSANWLS